MTATPDPTTDEPTETDVEIAEALYAAGAYCGSCDYEAGPCPDCNDCLLSYVKALQPALAAIRRQAAVDALTEQARHLDGRARFWRDLQRSHEAKGRPESADPYRHYADQAHRTADYLRKEAQGIIAEGYEYECAAGWDQCENRVPEAGDYCPRHEPEDDEDPRWAE
jgi:hypothetical protein